MAATADALRRFFFGESPAERSWNPWAQSYFSFGGNMYPYSPSTSTTIGSKQEVPDSTYSGYTGAYQSNGIVFACNQARMRLFAEARFQYRQLRNGRPGDLFGTADLAILENPWPNATTRDLLKRAIQDVDIAGNFYCAREGSRLRRMRPDWVSIVLGSRMDADDPSLALDAEVIGYVYHPGGYQSHYDTISLLPEQVCHFAPIPDPQARFRGMTWMTPIIREFMADNAMSEHKLKFFEQGATVNLMVTFPEAKSQEQFDMHVQRFKRQHESVGNAYKTFFAAEGTAATPIGSNMEQIDFKIVQAAGEVRIAAAAGVPPIVASIQGGLDAATYSNYGQARRAFADGTMRDLWGDFCGSIASIINVPSGAELWYDDRNISFLQDDMLDNAEIQQKRATAVNTLIIAGYEPDAVIDAVLADDLARLRGKHTGLFSVQLQPPGTEAAPANGNGNGVPIGAT
jgi:phage portal protein BeeE